MVASLTSEEKIALRRVGNGSDCGLTYALTSRLCGLRLIEKRMGEWHLTPLGRQHFESLPKPLLHTNHNLAEEVNRSMSMGAGLREGETEQAGETAPEVGLGEPPIRNDNTPVDLDQRAAAAEITAEQLQYSWDELLLSS